MSFGSFSGSIRGFLPEARDRAEDLMQDTCVVEFKTGRTTQSETTA